MSEAVRRALRVVAYQTDGSWVAHCVDFDIAVQAENLDDALLRFEIAVEAEYEYTTQKYSKPFQGIGVAPDYIEAMFESTATTLTSEMDVRIAA